MKISNTGVVRRIDDLGRIVIPREFRRVLHIEEGDAFELYLIEEDDGKKFVGFHPYSPVDALHRNKILRALRPSFEKKIVVGVVDASGETFSSGNADQELRASSYELFREMKYNGRERTSHLSNGAEVFIVPLRLGDDVVGGILICGNLTEEGKSLLKNLSAAIGEMLC